MFPSIAATAVSYTNVGSTSHTVSLPSGVVNGSRVMAMIQCESAATFTWPAGWTEIYDAANESGVSVAYRDCDGSEGASITVTSSLSATSQQVTIRIAGHDGGIAPTLASATGDGTSNAAINPDPPNCNPGVARDYLWLVLIAHDLDTSITAAANYTEAVNDTGGGDSGTVYVAYRQLNASSENPGAFVDSPGDTWTAFTIAIAGQNSVAVSETVTLTEALAAARATAADVSETVDVTEAVAADFGHGAPLAESVDLSESVSVATAISGSRTYRELADNDAPHLAYVLVFEGYDLALTDTEDVDGMALAWSNATEWTNVVGGLLPTGTIQHSAMPFDAAVQMPGMSFGFVDDDDDTLARIFLREANDEAARSRLVWAPGPSGAGLDNTDTAAIVDDASGFAVSGTVHIGGEEIAYGGKLGDILLSLTRGIRSLFGTLTDPDHFGQHHRIDEDYRSEVSTTPRTWLGRNVALYLCAEIDGEWTAGSEAEMAWAGTIRSIIDQDGHIQIECQSILHRLKTQLLRRQYRGVMQEGIYIRTDQDYLAVAVARFDAGGSVEQDANATTTVISSDDYYTHEELRAEIQDQIDAWFTGGTPFDATQSLKLELTAEGRYRWVFADSQAGTEWSIAIVLPMIFWGLLGWETSLLERIHRSGIPCGVLRFGHHDAAFVDVDNPGIVSDAPNLASGGFWSPSGIPNTRIVVLEAVNTYDPQPSIPTPAVLDFGEATGFLRVGGPSGFVLAVHESGTPNEFIVDAFLGHPFGDYSALGVTDPGGPVIWSNFIAQHRTAEGVPVEQVWFETGPANDLFMRLLLSTGTEGYNNSDFDSHPQQMALGLPWMMVDATAIYAALGPNGYVLFLAKPTDFLPLLESALQVRNLHAFFHRGQITVTGFGETTATSLRLTTDHMGRVVRDGEALAPAAQPLQEARTTDYLINQITLKYNIPLGGAGGAKPSTVVVNNTASQEDLKEIAPVAIDAIGFYDNVTGIDTGSLLDDWNENVAAVALAYFGRPLAVVTCTYDLRLLLELYPGRAVLLTNETIFDPRTGTRGVVDLPVWCVATSFDHQAGLGQAVLLFNPENVE